jgi:hypothetical protein
MQITFNDGLFFGELTEQEFIDGLVQEGYSTEDGKLLADNNVKSLLVVAVMPDLNDGGRLFAQDFDKVVVYSQYDHITSDGLSFLEFTQGDAKRYFWVGQEPMEVYVGSYNKKEILSAAEEYAEENDYSPRSFLKYVSQFVPNSVVPDMVCIYISM